jgi:phosphatidylinositol alpha-1,6-mannosyltransferase
MAKSTNTLKILFITRKWPPAVGGMETYSYELVQTFKQRPLNIKVIALAGKGNGDPPNAVALIAFLLKTMWFILRHRNQFDIVHIGDFVLAPLGVLSRWVTNRSKTVMMIHGLDILFGNRQGVAPTIYRIFQSSMTKLGCADHFIANSTNTGQLCERNKLLPVSVIPLGVNTSLPSMATKTHDNTILFVGRLVTRKGVKWFTQNVLPQLDQKFKFKVVGKTWDKSEQDALDNNTRVERVGYASDELLNQLKAKCMVAVMPNQPSENNIDVEGFGLVAAELSVQGIPLIASNIEGLTSAVINKKTGFLIEHNNIEAWINHIHAIANWNGEQRVAFSADCRKQALDYYSWDRVANETIELYKNLVISADKVIKTNSI